jgi:hypothetical protein
MLAYRHTERWIEGSGLKSALQHCSIADTEWDAKHGEVSCKEISEAGTCIKLIIQGKQKNNFQGEMKEQ